jgi:hypothetical protein
MTVGRGDLGAVEAPAAATTVESSSAVAATDDGSHYEPLLAAGGEAATAALVRRGSLLSSSQRWSHLAFTLATVAAWTAFTVWWLHAHSWKAANFTLL